ncbi:AAA family ATPase [Ruegeria arenilitoris]|uniref:AAA family ATPase n=1 Tax=Ruegeria arenilitoris TaxID=1173585 RepID=UPI00147DD90B|nr:AAA family ATPase [Ruegeria arenilitoris]
MFFFNRKLNDGIVPSSLISQQNEARREMEEYLLHLSPERRAQTDPPFVWKRPFGRDVLPALHEMAYGKCPFCERRLAPEDLLVYRFRPPSRASDGRSKPDLEAYLWLTFNWQNLFPICRECRPLDSSRFPVRGKRWAPGPDVIQGLLTSPASLFSAKEQPLLLFPGEWKRILKPERVTFDGRFPNVAMGFNAFEFRRDRLHATIDHFHLDRPELVAARRAAIQNRIELLYDGIVLTKAEKQDSPDALEFASTFWVLFGLVLREFQGELDNWPKKKLPTLRQSIAGLEKAMKSEGGIAAVRFAISKLTSTAVEAGDPFEPAPVSSSKTAAKPTPSAKAAPGTAPKRDFPRLTKISIRNFKSLESVELNLKPELTNVDKERLVSPKHTSLPEAPCLLILGENATGKSSILEAIVLACLTPAERKTLDLNVRRLTLDPDYLGELESQPRQTAEVELTFTPKRKLLLTMDRETGKMSGSPRAQRPLIFAFGAHRLYGREASETPVSRVETLFYPERSISNPEAWLTELHENNPGEIHDVIMALRYLIEIDGDFENIERRETSSGEPRWLINFQRSRNGKTKVDPNTGEKAVEQLPYTVTQRFDTVSSGYRAVLALVCEVLAGLYRAFPGSMYEARLAHAIVVVDEIEAHLHPRWKLTIIDRLRRALPNVTFIFTSHDPLCVRGTVQGEVVVLNRYINDLTSTTGVLPEAVESVAIAERAEHLTVEQMLNSDLFRLLTTEGENTQREYARVADILAKQERREDLTSEETHILDAFTGEIREALPYGDTVIPRLVQEAVAEYVRDARDRSSAEHKAKRKEAVERLKAFLAGTLQ